MTAIPAKTDDKVRQNLRLDAKVWTATDVARGHRAGAVSRNTWMTEAILEKLAREQNNIAPTRNAGNGDV